jgi:hypothetical protein
MCHTAVRYLSQAADHARTKVSTGSSNVLTKLQTTRGEFGWSQSRLIAEIRKRARLEGTALASDASLKTEISRHENGRVVPDAAWRRLYRAVYGRTDEELGFRLPRALGLDASEVEELDARLNASASMSATEVYLIRAQVDHIRTLDRQLGAHAVLDQLRRLLTTINNLRTHSLRPALRQDLACVVADAAALAGWQALDIGAVGQAWGHYEDAKDAARESESPALLAHAMAEQAVLLLEVRMGEQAVELIQAATDLVSKRGPPLLTAWLHATEAEAWSVTGADLECRRRLDAAAARVPRDTADPALPFIFLDDSHLARWRGNCLARLGDDRAVEASLAALGTMDATFARAEAGLRCDLAQAMVVRGDLDEAYTHAQRARQLALRVGSVRQRRRIERLISGSGLDIDRISRRADDF